VKENDPAKAGRKEVYTEPVNCGTGTRKPTVIFYHSAPVRINYLYSVWLWNPINDCCASVCSDAAAGFRPEAAADISGTDKKSSPLPVSSFTIYLFFRSGIPFPGRSSRIRCRRFRFVYRGGRFFSHRFGPGFRFFCRSGRSFGDDRSFGRH